MLFSQPEQLHQDCGLKFGDTRKRVGIDGMKSATSLQHSATVQTVFDRRISCCAPGEHFECLTALVMQFINRIGPEQLVVYSYMCAPLASDITPTCSAVGMCPRHVCTSKALAPSCAHMI